VFESARAKIARARGHLDFLKADFARFAGGQPYTILKQLDAQTGDTTVVYDPVPLPPCWPLIIGEFLYNLRSALDHLVYDLQGPIEKSEFPIFLERHKFFLPGKKGEYSTVSGMYKIRGIQQARVQRFIELVQPYNGPKHGVAPEFHALWGLHRLNNIDKHRTLHLCRRTPLYATLERDRPFKFSGSELIFPEDLEHRAVVGKLRGTDGEVNVNYDFALFITFDESEVPAIVGKRVETICDRFLGQVVLVVDKIESFVV
jgi:hypothetical protein